MATTTADRVESIADVILVGALVLLFDTRLNIQFTLPKLFVANACTAALALLWLWRYASGRVRPLDGVVLLLIVVMVAWWGVTTASAIDRATALNGAPGRYNGFWTSTMLAGLFLITATSASSAEHLWLRVKVLLVAVGFAALYACVQRLGWDPYRWPFSRPASTIGQPVTLATVLAMGAPCALVAAMSARQTTGRIAWGVLLLLLVLGVAATGSRAPFAAMVLACALAVALLARVASVPRRTFVLASAAVLVVFLAGALYVARVRTGHLFPNPAVVMQGAEVQNRLQTMKAAARMARDHAALGTGLENYHVLYPRYRPPEAERLTPDSVPTMVHSGYLQVLVTTGLPGLAVYVGFLGVLWWVLVGAYWRQSAGVSHWVIVASLCATIAYALAFVTGWPEVSVDGLFFIVAGWGVSAASVDLARDPSRRRQLGSAIAAAVLVIGVVAAVRARHDWEFLTADRALRSAQEAAAARDWFGAEDGARDVMRRAGADASFQDGAGLVFAQVYGMTSSSDLYSTAAACFEQAATTAPFSEYYALHRIDLETAALQKHKGGIPAPAVEQAILNLTAFDHHNASIYESIVRVRLAEGQAAAALPMIERAEALRPAVADYRRLEGDTRRALGDRDAAASAYRRALPLLQPGSPEWLNVERRLAVTLFEAGRYDEGLSEVRAALVQAPSDSILQRLLQMGTEARSGAPRL